MAENYKHTCDPRCFEAGHAKKVVNETCGCVRVGGEIVSYCGGTDLFPETPEHICACPKCGITMTVPCAGEIVADVKIGGTMEVRCVRPS